MNITDVAQWVIDNRYPKSEFEKLSDAELYHDLIEKIELLQSQNSVKLPVSGWQEFGKLKPKVGDEVVVMDKRNGRKQVWNIKDENFDEEWLQNYCWHLPPA